MNDREPMPEQDDRQWAEELSQERRERAWQALYNAAMIGVQEDDLRVLCSEYGLTYRDLETYTPHILRPTKERAPTLDLFPF